MPNRHTINGAPLNSIKQVTPFLPELEDSESQPTGSWLAQGLSFGDERGSFNLIELRASVDVEIPTEEFSLADFPNADFDATIGQIIPIGFGVVKGAQGFLIDTGLNKFKLFNHPVRAMTAFYDSDGVNFTPDSFNLTDATFTYSAWDGDAALFADVDIEANDPDTFETDNPVDVVRELLTGGVNSERGAGLSTAELNTETTPAGQGFGSDGARVKYIKGLEGGDGDESTTFPISLYVTQRTKVTDLIDQVKSFCMGFVYVMTTDTADNPGVWNFRAFEPVTGDDLLEVTEDKIKGLLRAESDTRDAITSAIGRYAVNHGTGQSSPVTYSNDELRQKRGLPVDSVLDKNLPTTDKEAATLWAQNQVEMRGRAQRMFEFVGTNELKLLQPGDSVKLNYAPTGINEVALILETTQTPGEIEVPIKAIDVFGYRDEPGFWADDSPTFPTSLGGGTITAWDDTWTDDQKDWARENIGFWTDDDGYADVTDDPLQSYLPSTWS
jgi:hypothetical protein